MRPPFNRFVSTMAVLSLVAFGASAAPALAAEAGPPLETPTATLQQSVSCTADLGSADKTPILLVHGTFTNSAETWNWGYERVFAEQGHPVCTVKLPERATIDLQTTVEYVVHAIRHANEESGREIAVIGHSQGGVLPVWALRFWPDLAERVDDMISLAGPMNGTALANGWCVTSWCPDVTHQLSNGSAWVTALRGHPVDPSVSFTSIGSWSDEVVFPAPTATRFPDATNVMVQDVCSLRVVGHIGLLSDAVTHALVTDALEHSGPTDTDRVSDDVCRQGDYPGIDRAGRAALLATGIAGLTAFATLPYTTHEPDLRSYAVSG